MTEQKKKPPKDDRPQIERFKEAAKAVGADESEDAMEKAFTKINPVSSTKAS